jgi:hypothetical protein
MADDSSTTANMGPKKMDKKTERAAQSGMGDKASAKSPSGAAGSTTAAKRGGEHSHDNR